MSDQHMKFESLSQPQDDGVEERRLHAMDMASENPTPYPMGESSPELGETPPAIAATASGSEDGGGGADKPEGLVAEAGETQEAPPPPEEAADEPVSEDATLEGQKGEEGLEAGKAETTTFDSLISLAAGEVGEDEVKIEPQSATATVSPFQALASARPRDPEAEREIDDLVSSLVSGPAPEGPARAGNDRGRAPGSGAAPQQAQPGQPAQTTSVPVGAPGRAADMAGQAIAEVIATPFLALSSAAKHLSNRFTRTGAVPGGAPRVSNSLLANTLETITDWKSDQILKAGEAVKRTAAELRDTEAFVTWEDDLKNAASSHGLGFDEVVRTMHLDPRFTGLKDKMDQLWANHPDKVEAYRDACGDFERNIRNVVKEYPNSEEDVKKRVMAAMTEVEKQTLGLPGFGDRIGEYTKTLAERVRELAQTIMEFMTALARRLGANTRSSDNTL